MLFESTLAGRRAKLGRDHPDTLLTTVDLARAYAAAGRNDKAIPLAREFVQTIARLEDSLPDSVLAAIPPGQQAAGNCVGTWCSTVTSTNIVSEVAGAKFKAGVAENRAPTKLWT
jgi:hypothetical protein